MRVLRPQKRVIYTLAVILIIQLTIAALYYHFNNNLNNEKEQTPNKKEEKSVSFVNKILGNNEKAKEEENLFFTINSGLKIQLPVLNTKDSFVDFNSSVCFVNGTDLKGMKRKKNNWKCDCLSNWHGDDCSQPEVVWRAFLANKISIPPNSQLRKTQRRLIYIFEINRMLEDLTEIRIGELNDTVDLFILSSGMNASMELRLKNGFLKKYHKKILYLNTKIYDKNIWLQINNLIGNLNGDDVILVTGINEIFNKNALIFFKYYNKFPEPLSFRMKHLVYGFFWMHPSKTIMGGFASTVRHLNVNFESLFNGNFTNLKRKFLLGDLNHYGGWYCEFCHADIPLIIKATMNLNLHAEKKIDAEFLEDAIENGLYLDGTVLTRSRRYHDNYYAPKFVEDNSWKYDYLLYNMYAKIDY